jgi:hypothetical protein
MGEDPSAKIERLLRKAANDPQFKELLLAERSRAAPRIGVVLDVSEATLLDSVVEKQLKAMIEKTRRGPERAHGSLARLHIEVFGQSKDILQLPIMALRKRIEQEMNENPRLEAVRHPLATMMQ